MRSRGGRLLEAGEGLRVIWLQAQGKLELLPGLGDLALAQQDDPQVGASVGIGGFDLQRGVESLVGFRHPAGGKQGGAQIVVRLGEARRETQRGFVPQDRVAHAARRKEIVRLMKLQQREVRLAPCSPWLFPTARGICPAGCGTTLTSIPSGPMKNDAW